MNTDYMQCEKVLKDGGEDKIINILCKQGHVFYPELFSILKFLSAVLTVLIYLSAVLLSNFTLADP